jgi:hypothetical protein
LSFFCWVYFQSNQKFLPQGIIAMSKFLLIILMLANATTFAAINKWVDGQGQVHYSDQPPPSEVRAKTLLSTSESDGNAAATSAPAAPKTIAEREAELKKSQKAKQEAANKALQKQVSEDAKKASCATSQQNLRTLQEGIRMVEVDANGERSYMDDKQRQERIAKAQQDVATYCQ